MRTVRISEAKEIVKAMGIACIETNEVMSPVMLHSSYGIGKSSIVKQVANELGMEFLDIRVSAQDPSQIQGIAHIVNDYMEFSTPPWWPEDPDVPVMLFLDELTNATNSQQHAAYRLILDREIHNLKKLHNKVFIVAAGNRKEDKTGARGLLPALANRFGVHLNVTTTLEDVVEHIYEAHGSNEETNKLVGFLNWKPSLLSTQPTNGEVSFPTPRSWVEFVLKHLKTFGVDPDNHLLSTVVCGAVGDAAGQDFMTYLRFFDKVPNIKGIMEGKVEFKPEIMESDIGLQYAISDSLVTYATEAILLRKEDSEISDKYTENLYRIFEHFPHDIQTMVVKRLSSSLGKKNLGLIFNGAFKKALHLAKYVQH